MRCRSVCALCVEWAPVGTAPWTMLNLVNRGTKVHEHSSYPLKWPCLRLRSAPLHKAAYRVNRCQLTTVRGSQRCNVVLPLWGNIVFSLMLLTNQCSYYESRCRGHVTHSWPYMGFHFTAPITLTSPHSFRLAVNSGRHATNVNIAARCSVTA